MVVHGPLDSMSLMAIDTRSMILITVLFFCLANSFTVSAIPTSKREYNEPIYNHVQSLEDDLIRNYTIQCPMGEKLVVDKSILKNSPYLDTLLQVDDSSTDIFIKGPCNQETLILVTNFLEGGTIWNQITSLNVEELTILADFLQLDVLLDQCIVWIVKGMFLNEFQLSAGWMAKYPEHMDEIEALYGCITQINDIQLGKDSYLNVKVKGTDFYEKFLKIKRFSGLHVMVEGPTVIPTLQFNSNKSLRIRSLELSYHDQSQLGFLLASFPLLERLSLKMARLSDLGRLSKAFNDQKLPRLKELVLLWNREIKLNTLQLDKAIPLKVLNLGACDLTDISALAHILYNTPHLERLDLSSNWNIRLDTLLLDNPVSLKILDLGWCDLKDIAPLTNILYQMPQFEELILLWNKNIRISSFQLQNTISLKRLNLGWSDLTNISPLTNILNNAPNLEELQLVGNGNIELNTLQLDWAIPLKVLNLSSCGLTDISTLPNILYKMPRLEELVLEENKLIKLDTFQLDRDISVKRLILNDCGLTDISYLNNLRSKMPQLEQLELDNNQIM